MVDAHLRLKTIETADIKNLIIGGQTGIDGIRFCLAAVTNGENLADPAFSWFLQYKNKNGQGESVGLTPVYENGLVKLPWVPNKLATQVPGRMQIQLYAAIVTGEGEAAVVDKQWVSEPAVIYIQENINPEPIVAAEPSVIEYYVTLYAAYKNAAEAAAAAALVSEQAAGTSEDNAADHAAAALASKNAAGISETNAASHAAASLASKNAAGISETNAAGHAAAALASKNAAGISETNAAGHEAAALASKNAAGVSEGNASDSKLKAQKWAEEAKDVEVEPGKFSAKHWMEKASGVYDNFDARFLGYKNADPAVDNKGNALVQGALYFNSVSKMLRLYNGTAWGDLANSAAGITYSGAGSGLEGTNVQSAIDELNLNKVKATLIPDGSDVIYFKEFVNVSTIPPEYTSVDSQLALVDGELVATWIQGSGRINLAYDFGLPTEIKQICISMRKTGGVTGMYLYLDGPNVSVPTVLIKTVPNLYIFDISHLYNVPITNIRIYFQGGTYSGSTFFISRISVGDHDYLPNSLSTKASLTINKLGDTVAAGVKASGSIIFGDPNNLSAGDTLTIAGRTYTFRDSEYWSNGPVEGDVLIGDDASQTRLFLRRAINREVPASYDGIYYKVASAHSLVSASYIGTLMTLTARSIGMFGNLITLAKSASSLTISGSTLAGGIDDVGAKIKNQLESAYSGIPKFNSIAFPATQVPSADLNTLDDYEEGTFTPMLKISGSFEGITGTFSGAYTKIGRVVVIEAIVILTSKGVSAGTVTIDLPFVVGNILSGSALQGGGSLTYYSGFNGSVYDTSVATVAGNGVLQIKVKPTPESALATDVTNETITGMLSLRIVASYFVA